MFKDKNPERTKKSREFRIRAVAAGIAMAVLPASCAVDKVEEKPRTTPTEQTSTSLKKPEVTTTSAETFTDSASFLASKSRNDKLNQMVQKASKSILSHPDDYGQWFFRPLGHDDDIQDKELGIWGYLQNSPDTIEPGSEYDGTSVALVVWKPKGVDFEKLGTPAQFDSANFDLAKNVRGINFVQSSKNINFDVEDTGLEMEEHAGMVMEGMDMTPEEAATHADHASMINSWSANTLLPEDPSNLAIATPDKSLEDNLRIQKTIIDTLEYAAAQ